jgi:hypothetical protein
MFAGYEYIIWRITSERSELETEMHHFSFEILAESV